MSFGSLLIGASLALLPGAGMAQDVTDASEAAVEAPATLAPAPYRWTRAQPAQRVVPGVAFNSVVVRPDGEAIVVGSHAGNGRAWSWRYVDTLPTRPVALPGRGRIAPQAAGDIAGQVVAVGFREAGDAPRKDYGFVNRTFASAWRLTDAGEWDALGGVRDAMFQDLAVTDDGLLAVGLTVGRRGMVIPTVWASVDGASWRPSRVGAPVVMSFAKIAVSPAGDRIVGANVFDGESSASQLWRSDDGQTWEPVGWPDTRPASSLGAIVAVPTGFLLASNIIPSDPGSPTGLIWHSRDGRMWTQVADVERRVTAFAVTPAGQLAFTAPPLGPDFVPTAGLDPLVLMSSDGLTWRTAAADGLEDAEVSAVSFEPGGRALAIGSALGDEAPNPFTSQPVLWVGMPAEVGS